MNPDGAQQSFDAAEAARYINRIMRSDLAALLVLQDRDQKIKALHAQQKSYPLEKKSLEGRLATAKQVLEHARQTVKANEVERRKLELDVEGKRTSIGRFKTQQQQTRKNEEYTAFNKEIEHAEGEIRGLEDRELELMEQAEALARGAAVAAAEFSKAQVAIQDQLARLEEQKKAVDGRLVELQADHAKLAAGVPEETLDLYRRLFAKKGDAAVVPLESEICQGCHMKVPTQIVFQVRGDQGLTQCPQCGRILYRVV